MYSFAFGNVVSDRGGALKGTTSIRLNELTDRQQEISKLIVRGQSNVEIAERLHLSTPTIKAEVSRILKKLEVSKRSELAVLLSK